MVILFNFVMSYGRDYTLRFELQSNLCMWNVSLLHKRFQPDTLISVSSGGLTVKHAHLMTTVTGSNPARGRNFSRD